MRCAKYGAPTARPTSPDFPCGPPGPPGSRSVSRKGHNRATPADSRGARYHNFKRRNASQPTGAVRRRRQDQCRAELAGVLPVACTQHKAACVQVNRVHDGRKAKYATNAPAGPLSCFLALKPCQACSACPGDAPGSLGGAGVAGVDYGGRWSPPIRRQVASRRTEQDEPDSMDEAVQATRRPVVGFAMARGASPGGRPPGTPREAVQATRRPVVGFAMARGASPGGHSVSRGTPPDPWRPGTPRGASLATSQRRASWEPVHAGA
jgi:hypothetical protein